MPINYQSGRFGTDGICSESSQREVNYRAIHSGLLIPQYDDPLDHYMRYRDLLVESRNKIYLGVLYMRMTRQVEEVLHLRGHAISVSRLVAFLRPSSRGLCHSRINCETCATCQESKHAMGL